jgi:hypothetical protein
LLLGPRKEPRYTFPFCQKSWQINSLQVPQQDSYGEGGPFAGHFAYLSKKPHLSGSPVKEPLLKVPFMESLTERCPTTRALLHSSIKVPSIQASPPPVPGTHFPFLFLNSSFLSYVTVFRCFYKVAKTDYYLHFVCLSASPHGTTGLTMEILYGNLIFEIFWKNQSGKFKFR